MHRHKGSHLVYRCQPSDALIFENLGGLALPLSIGAATTYLRRPPRFTHTGTKDHILSIAAGPLMP